MASHFDRWEKDPFFSAAEEVQESADRYLSVARIGFDFLNFKFSRSSMYK